jgi:hypothetical protein
MPITVSPQVIKEKTQASFNSVPFWSVLEQLARQTNTKLVLSEKGRKLSIEPKGESRESSSVSGPFRIVTRQVVARSLLDVELTVYEVQIDAHWEPRYTVFRIDSNPKILRAEDDRGRKLTAKTGTARVQPEGSISDLHVALEGLSRASTKISVVTGEFVVTASPSQLAFRFEDLTTKLPVAKTQSGVTAVLKRIEDLGKIWEVELELRYPSGQPAFESFEETLWLRDNRPRLVSPDASKTFGPDGFDYRVSDDRKKGRAVTAVYGFKGVGNPLEKGWALTYETPAPLVELTIPFELRDIPLP